MKRYGSIVGLKEDAIPEYKRLHEAVWPEVLATITACGIRNYTIFLRQMPDGKHYLFSTFEYVGDDFQADMFKMAADPKTQEWWTHCMPLQEPLPDRPEGEWWAPMLEVFHVD